MLLVVEFEVPDELTVPGELLDPAAAGGSGEESFLAPELTGAEQVPILQQISTLPRGVVAVPRFRITRPFISTRKVRVESKGAINVYPGNGFGASSTSVTNRVKAARSARERAADRTIFASARPRPGLDPMPIVPSCVERPQAPAEACPVASYHLLRSPRFPIMRFSKGRAADSTGRRRHRARSPGRPPLDPISPVRGDPRPAFAGAVRRGQVPAGQAGIVGRVTSGLENRIDARRARGRPRSRRCRRSRSPDRRRTGSRGHTATGPILDLLEFVLLFRREDILELIVDFPLERGQGSASVRRSASGGSGWKET